jgi:division protein CdvB (Snf7/Vps24/ESCRT-III family)
MSMDVESVERVRLLLRESLTDIELVSYNLDKIVRNLRRKDSEYLEKVSLFLEKKDHERARAYAQEIAMLRKVAKMVYQSSLLVLTIKLRLETMLESEELYGMVPSLVRLLSAVSELGPLPNLEKEFAGIKTKLEEAAAIITKSTEIKVDAMSDEAERVIKEAEKLALMKIEKTFPKVPQTLVNEEAKQRVFEYLKLNSNSFDIEKCAKDLSMEREEVERLLDELVKERRIVIKKGEEAI